MAHIILPQKWQRQPTGRVAIDLNNPLVNGIAFAHSGNMPEIGYESLAESNGPPVFYGTASGYKWNTIKTGLNGWQGNSARAHAFRWKLRTPIYSDSNWTIACLATPENAASEQARICIGTGVNSIRAQLDHYTNAYRVYGGYGPRSAGAGSAASNKKAFVVATHVPAGTTDIYVDGLLKATGGDINTSHANFNYCWVGGRYSTALGLYTTDTIFMGLVWRRTLSDVEIYTLNENPWQIFKPKTQTTFFLGSIGIPTLSFPGVTDITPGSARPKVTLTF